MNVLKRLLIITVGVLSFIGVASPVFAADSIGQSVIDNLEAGSKTMKLPDSDLQQAKNYINSHSLTQNQADRINNAINQSRIIFNSVSSISQLTPNQKNQIQQYVNEAADAIGASVSWTRYNGKVNLNDNGSGSNNSSNNNSGSSNDTSNGTSDNNGSGSSEEVPVITGKDGKVIYTPASVSDQPGKSAIVKQTGAGSYLVPIIGIVLVALSGVGAYLFINKSKRTAL